MNQRLLRADLDDAVDLGIETLKKYEGNRREKYENSLNSHVKGRLGEFALEKWLVERQVAFISYFRNPRLESLCDIEVESAAKFKRIEIKTWSLEFWEPWGRCIQVRQLNKIQNAADAVLWCTVDLPSIKSVAQLRTLEEVFVEFVGYSTPADIGLAPIRSTGPKWNLIVNHQLENTDLRPITELLTDLIS